MSNKSFSQSELWGKQYLLFRTTNLIVDPVMRIMLAINDVTDLLKATLLDRDSPKQKNWRTYAVKIQAIEPLLLEGCEVGKNGTTFKDCIESVINAMRDCDLEGVNKIICTLEKYKDQLTLNVQNLSQSAQKFHDSVCCEMNIVASGCQINALEAGVVTLTWSIPLQKKAKIPSD